MTRIWAVLREVAWLSVITLLLAVASVVSVFVLPALAIPAGLASIALAVLSLRA